MKGTTHKGWKNKAKKQHSRGNAILHCISLCKQESALVCYGVLHVCCDRGVRRSYGETKGSFSSLSNMNHPKRKKDKEDTKGEGCQYFSPPSVRSWGERGGGL